MKRKKAYLLSAAFAALTASAQDIYKMEMFSGEDLNGTSRFVGMGGAMSALGADISTMGTNPAGTGFFRRSDFSISASALIQPNAEDFMNRGKSRASFDQIGFVISNKLDEDVKFINIGFNYHKRRNLKSFIGTGDVFTNGLSQSWQMMDLAYTDRWLDLDSYDGNRDREYTTPLTLLGYDSHMLDMKVDENDKVTGYEPVDAESYNYRRAQWGGIHQYDFNISLNWNDQIYAGITAAAYSVNLNSATEYMERIYDPAGGNGTYPYYMSHRESLSGSGVDFKMGVILRPFEYSPFRVGVSVHSPIFFNLKSDQYLAVESPFEDYDGNNLVADRTFRSMDPGRNEYKIRTPWRFNLSMATTVGKTLALNAEYEYRNFSTTQVRYPSYYDDGWDNSFWDGSDKDVALADEAERFLKPVHTARIGVEWRVLPDVYLRGGYNHETSPFEKDAFLNQFTPSSSYYYSCNTDYVNLSHINRWTAGLGIKGDHFYMDFAYQYHHQNAMTYAFHVPTENSDITNRLSGYKTDLSRHQVLFTLGYKF